MTLRPALPEDAEAVAALERDVFGPDAWSVPSVLEELTGVGRAGVVALLDGTLVGYALTRHTGDAVDLQRIAVHPGHRRRGVGRRLLAAALERAGDAAAVLLEVSERNQAAVTFYTGQGFTPIDRRRRYYRDGSDALVLRRPPAGGAPAATTGGERQ